MAFLGWNPKTDLKPKSAHPELLLPEELAQAFDLNGLQKAPAVFDVEKLKWMNAQYMRLLSSDLIAEYARPFFEASEEALVKEGLKQSSPEFYVQMVDILRAEHGLLSDLPKAAAVFFNDTPMLAGEAKTILSDASAQAVVKALESGIAALPENFTKENFEVLQKEIAASCNVKGKALFMPIRIAVTGELHGPEMKRVIPLLGKARVLKRIQHLQKQL